MPAPILPSFEYPKVLDLDVVAWRCGQLREAGYPVEVAIDLAWRGDVDLHVATRLLERGASIDDALRILT